MVDVAQLVEPRIVIPAVAGSSPVVHPTFDDGCESSSALLEKVFGPLAQLVEQLTLNQLVVGSIPTRPTIQRRSRTSKKVHGVSEIADGSRDRPTLCGRSRPSALGMPR